MFDISEKMIVGQLDEIDGVTPVDWEDSSWKQLCLVSDEEVISLSHAKVYVFSDSVLCLGKENETQNQILLGKTSWRGSRVHQNTELWTKLMVSQWNSSGISSQDSLHCSSATKSKSSQTKWAISQKNLQDGSSHGVQRQWKGMRIKRSARLSFCEKIVIRTMVIPRTWIRKEMFFYSRIQTTRRMGQSCRANDDKNCKKQTPSIPIHESIIQRRTRQQRWWKIVNILLCRWSDVWNCFSHNYFCSSAQSLRSSRRNVWRMWLLPW